MPILQECHTYEVEFWMVRVTENIFTDTIDDLPGFSDECRTNIR